ncbi:MAG: hypothetical protein RID91_06955 [Azospirillaceae bacterium]
MSTDPASEPQATPSAVAAALERLDRALDGLETAIAERDRRWQASLEAADQDLEVERSRRGDVAGRVDHAISRLEAVLAADG